MLSNKLKSDIRDRIKWYPPKSRLDVVRKLYPLLKQYNPNSTREERGEVYRYAIAYWKRR